MQHRVTLTRILSFIDEASVHIIEVCGELRKEVKEKGLLVDDLARVFPKMPKDAIIKEIDERLVSYIALPEIVKKEIDAFVTALDASSVENDETGTFNYMREVWLGDIYGVTGLEALKELAKELKKRVEVDIQDEELLKALAASIELKK